MRHFQFSDMSSRHSIIQGISTRDFGKMRSEENGVNEENLGKFLNFLHLPNNAVTMSQVHGNSVEVVDKDSNPKIENADGLITAQKNVPLCVVTADCLPVLFYDPEKKIIGVAHAGRKGLAAGIISQTLEKFVTKFKSEPKDILVGIGPGIEKKCYEVDGKFVDIRADANTDLIKNGIEGKNIENVAICTKCNSDKFYSYRGGDGTNRFATVIAMV